MKIEFLHFVVPWLNAFPVRGKISKVFSPRDIIVRSKMSAKKHCRVLPGSYYKVYDEPDPYNAMVTRIHEEIAFGPACNLQGSVKFYYI